MEIIAIVIGLLIAAAIAWYVSQPILAGRRAVRSNGADSSLESLAVQRDMLYAQISDLDLDHATGKTNEEDYQHIRADLMARAVGVLRQIDGVQAAPSPDLQPAMAVTAADDIEAAIAARRKHRPVTSSTGAPPRDRDADLEAAIAARRKRRPVAAAAEFTPHDRDADIEAAIAARRKTRGPAASSADLDQQIDAAVRSQRSAPMCPQCGKPVAADDAFCSKCGAALQPQTAR